MGYYILPSLKDFVPEISKLRRMYPTNQSSIYSTIIQKHPLSLTKFQMLYELMQKCVYMFLI